MKRNRIWKFLQQKQYAIASFVLFAAIAAMAGVYFSDKLMGVQQDAEIAEDGTDADAQDEYALFDAYEKDREQNAETQGQEDAESVTSVIRPKETSDQAGDVSASQGTSDQAGDVSASQGTSVQPGDAETETQEREKNQEKNQAEGHSQDGQAKGQGQEQPDTPQDADAQNAKQTQAANTSALHFSPETDLVWPLEGDVILNYSMDQTVYFATLDQYKYNPALIIAGKVNDQIKAAATGKITDISTNEETGLTITMDLGDGYTAIYGQLKEALYKEGAVVEAGNAIGYIAEPTKYYSVEGSNLYFELQKDGKPINPMQYIAS